MSESTRATDRPAIKPYGEWRSPITADMIVSRSIGLGSPRIAGGRDGGGVMWLENRPAEAGRTAIVRSAIASDGPEPPADAIPPPFSARSRVHEYGGGAYLPLGDGSIIFANAADQRLYRVAPPAADPQPLTGADTGLRFAAFEPDLRRGRLIAIVEDHSATSSAPPGAGHAAQPTNFIGVIDLATGAVSALLTGRDFYANPCLSPDGARLAWLAWDHPEMPWDAAELWLADVDAAGAVSGHRRIAGGRDASVFQPRWSPTGELTFVSEASGWWNLACLREGAVVALTGMEAEFGRPLWNLDASSYAFIADDTIICAYMQHGTAHLALLDTASKALTRLDCPCTVIEGVDAHDGRAVFIAASPEHAARVVAFDARDRTFTVLKTSSDITIDAALISRPVAIEFPTGNGSTAHAFYYPPCNPGFEAPADERPPVLVKSHGGPTGATGTGLKLGYLYWTSRGIGVLDVNYGGSTGYGRDYRRRLDGHWGILDVDDCVSAARHLAAIGKADPARLIISGGSAGGFTTLCALTFRDVFKAGASYYGISDIEALARDTHKFESRYLDSLIGPYPARRDLYVARSPLHFADRIAVPLLLLQGLDDKVVPPEQSRAMFEAVRANGVPTAYLAFEGELHGFRKAETIKRALEAEYRFYARVFGYVPADPLEPVAVDNI